MFFKVDLYIWQGFTLGIGIRLRPGPHSTGAKIKSSSHHNSTVVFERTHGSLGRALFKSSDNGITGIWDFHPAFEITSNSLQLPILLTLHDLQTHSNDRILYLQQRQGPHDSVGPLSAREWNDSVEQRVAPHCDSSATSPTPHIHCSYALKLISGRFMNFVWKRIWEDFFGSSSLCCHGVGCLAGKHPTANYQEITQSGYKTVCVFVCVRACLYACVCVCVCVCVLPFTQFPSVRLRLD